MIVESMNIDNPNAKAPAMIQFNRHILALLIPTQEGREWITMDSTKRIPSDIITKADIVVDVRQRSVLKGPEQIEVVNNYHNKPCIDTFSRAMVQQQVVCPTRARELIYVEH